jgi:hypothetical protein
LWSKKYSKYLGLRLGMASAMPTNLVSGETAWMALTIAS